MFHQTHWVFSRSFLEPFGPRTLRAENLLGVPRIISLRFHGWRTRPETLAGLAGLGDLVLTCTGSLSRNRTVGVELGKGQKLADIVGAMRMVAEGVKTTYAAVALARRHGVEMPITEQVHRLLEGQVSPREAIRELMERPPREE